MLLLFCGLFVCILWILLMFPREERVKAPQFTLCNRSCQRYLFRVLWSEGFFPTVGYQVERYELDLAFPNKKIAIECGWNEWERTDLDRARSRKKKQVLQEQGWQVIFLSPKEIYGNPRQCVEKIEQCLARQRHIY